jgi:hypothetical protein
VIEPIYWCLIGNDLPFHKRSVFDRYKSVFSETLELLDGKLLERAAVDLLPETKLGAVVANYLVQAYPLEQPSSSLLKNLPEVSATEQKLNEIIRRLHSDRDIDLTTPKRFPEGYVQPPLGLDQTGLRLTSSSPHTLLPVPESLMGSKMGSSQYGPLIFWALVFLRLSGKKFCSGVEITDVINHHLVDDHNHKFPNNVSRALRNRTLQAQPWLTTNMGFHRTHVRYGVVENWEEFWKPIFGEAAPEIEQEHPEE